MKSFAIRTLVLACLFAAAQSAGAPAAFAGPSLCNGAANGIIDGDEQCETGACCTAKCELKSADTVCRAKSAQCDVAETCGDQAPAADAACPADALADDGTTCDDGLFCTQDDACTAGTCGGAPGTCDDGNPCTSDSCNENNNKCGHDDAEDGTACDDGSACTSGDTCGGGVCRGGEETSCDDDNLCTDDSCNAETGACEHSSNARRCDDGNFCTTNDSCSDGVCGGEARNCADSNPCSIDTCDEEADTCLHEAAANGTACEDGDFCTVDDVCTDGVCDGAPNTCDDDNDCTDDSCHEDSNSCKHLTLFHDEPCDDGLYCTHHDKCTGNGSCQGEIRECNDENECTTDVCDLEVDACVFTNNTNACDDGLFCTTNDVCADGACTGGPADACDDGNDCTTDACNEATDSCGYENVADGSTCDDGEFCTSGDVCTAGACAGPTPNSCDDANDCTKDSCNESADECQHQSTNNNKPCDDGNFCTVGDTCFMGTCEGEARDCGDGNLCTDDVCDEAADACTNPNNSAPCDDGNFCTTGDSCGGGSCSVFSPTCDDANACTTDTCNEASDTCGHENSSGGSCEDGQFCTVGDTCSNGVCVAGTARDCGDSNACTDDSCNEQSDSCDNAPNADPCDDGQFCTVSDVCSGGTCSGSARDCSDPDACTDDICDESANACTHVNNTAPCDDGAFCTVGDTCANGACTAGSARDCGDANVCTTDACNEATDACEYSNNTLACDDGLFCTVLDSCSGGVCSGGLANPCDDANGCTTDSCDEAGNACVNSPNTSACNDNDPCTENDVCAAGTCSGTEIPNCSATTTTVPTTTTTLECPTCGDFNGDCEISASDALAVLQAAVGIHPCELSVCDFSGDGKITALDALAVLRAAVGLPADPMCPADGTTTTTLP